MNLLVINLVKATFDENSTNRKRLEEYSRLADKIFVIVWIKGNKKSIMKNGLFIFPTNSKSRFFYLFDTFLIARKIFKTEKIDLVITQDPFETGFAGWIIVRLFRLKLLIQVHADFLSPYFWQESFLNKIRVLLAKFLIKKADCLQVVSGRIKNSLISKYRDIETSKIVVLPIFVDIKKLQEAPIKENLHQKYPQFDFIILMASRFSKEKNIGLAIKAMAEVIKKYPKTGLVIVGDGPELINLKTIAQNSNLDKQIIFEGRLAFEELISYYKTADLFLLTSNYEGYGMAVVEAMVCGLPVIMTDVGLAGEVLINKQNGLVIPVGDGQKLREAILELIEKTGLKNNLASKARAVGDSWPSQDDYLKNHRTAWLNCL